MTIDEILENWQEDAKLDRSELSIEASKVAILHHKYLKIRSREILNLIKYKSEKNKLYKLKYEYYNGNLDKETLDQMEWKPFQMKVLKSDIPMYIEADQEYSDLSLKLSLLQEKIEILDSILKTINNRNFSIRSAIDFLKFTHGS